MNLKKLLRRWLEIPNVQITTLKLECPEKSVVIFRYLPGNDPSETLITWQLLRDHLSPIEVVLIPDDTVFHTAIQK